MGCYVEWVAFFFFLIGCYVEQFDVIIGKRYEDFLYAWLNNIDGTQVDVNFVELSDFRFA